MVGDNRGICMHAIRGSDRSYHEGYGSYRRKYARVMRVITSITPITLTITPITLEKPVRNSCNPGCNTLETGRKKEGPVLNCAIFENICVFYVVD